MYNPINRKIEENEAKIATTVTRVEKMNIFQMLDELGYTKSEITGSTYLYVDADGDLAGIEKRDRQSYPEDEVYCVGYVVAYGGSIGAIRAGLKS